MDLKKKALEHADYVSTFKKKNQKRILQEKYTKESQYIMKADNLLQLENLLQVFQQ